MMCVGLNFNFASNELTLEVRAAVVGLLAEAFGVLLCGCGRGQEVGPCGAP